jgi:hypothetical protein
MPGEVEQRFHVQMLFNLPRHLCLEIGTPGGGGMFIGARRTLPVEAPEERHVLHGNG